jgi:hypothetical protein
LQDAMLCADFAVRLEVAPGLAHEPHGANVRGSAPACFEEPAAYRR